LFEVRNLFGLKQRKRRAPFAFATFQALDVFQLNRSGLRFSRDRAIA
jgi:hypothetical protein